MSDIAIKVENLSKKYHIGHRREAYRTLRDTLTNAARAPIRRMRSFGRASHREEDTIWALNDISFDVKQGEVLGLIGRNGSGKSTLLKILARITEPTKGRAEIRGRVGSLLDVATGFHPELTGRENVYLGGNILGMRKVEIDRKFDEIVAFSGIETFIDTPVKRYSSGMAVRLGFAVAAHLEPEILLVDEVLAVGDWEFQKKCLNKMGEVSREGHTVLLVSHNMASILNFCPRAILLHSGRLILDDCASGVVHSYTATRRASGAEVVWRDLAHTPGDEFVRLCSVRISAEDGEVTADLDIAKDIKIEIVFANLQGGAKLYPAIHLKDQTGAFVLVSPNLPSASVTIDIWCGKPLPRGLFRSTCRIPGNLLNEGDYTLDVVVNERIGFAGGAYALDVLSFHIFDSGAMRKEHLGSWPGVVRPRLAWQTEYIEPPVGAPERAN